MKSGITKDVSKITFAIFSYFDSIENGTVYSNTIDISTAERMRAFLIEEYGEEYYKEALKINHSFYKRTNRLRERIHHILTTHETTCFLTLTFSDETLSKTSEKTRRQHVTRFLKAHNVEYVANIDYGKKNGREHYHAVIGSTAKLSLWEKYGFIKSEYVHTPTLNKPIPKRYQEYNEDLQKLLMLADNEKRLSKYVSKLTNHAIKETTKRQCIIYSKKTS